MGKSMAVGIFGILLSCCGLSWRSAAAQSSNAPRTSFPKACYFFAPQKEDESEKRNREQQPAEERAYDASVAQVYRLWCTPNHGTIDERKAAVNEMVKRWKAVWERDDPYDAAFHETAAFDLLALLGITHELPPAMANDPQFVKKWIADCSYTCFHIGGDPGDQADDQYILMQLQLRNDVLDHLKKEPSSEPVLEMLLDAKFTLVD